MKIITIASGSKGNCTLVNTRGKNILIDCGGSYTRLKKGLGEKGLTFCNIDSILVTHSHDDHISALPLVQQKHPLIKVFAHTQCITELRGRVNSVPHEIRGDFESEGIEVEIYKCHHDASCIGYRLYDGEEKACFVTDTGCVDKKLISFVKGADRLLIESNHDYDMLIRGSYPPSLKRRIASMNGHLSNEQTAYLIERADLAETKEIILAHLSEINNTPDIAMQSALSVLSRLGIEKKIKIKVAKQWEVSE